MCHHVGGRKGGGGCAGLENGLGMGESEERTGERESSVHPDFYGFLCFCVFGSVRRGGGELKYLFSIAIS